MNSGFFNLHRHGFVRVAVATPPVALADPMANARAVIAMARAAGEQGASVVLFPELCISAYSIDDLLQQAALQRAVHEALAAIAEESRSFHCAVFVGAPLSAGGRLYNTAVAIQGGRILAVYPKTYLPNYREFYEKRHFASGGGAVPAEIRIAGEAVPFGTDILIEAEDLAGLVLHAEICEDVWTPVPPSTYAAMAGATVLLNLSASNITIGKAEERHALCRVQSSRCLAAYLYSAAGAGESTTDLAWDGQGAIYECGRLLAEAERFATEAQTIFADIDLGLIDTERQRQVTFGDCADQTVRNRPFRRISIRLNPDVHTDLGLMRVVPRFPYVPDDAARLAELCYEAYNIQSHGLVQRLKASGVKKVVIGVSGGLDSTQALLVAAHAFDRLGLPRTNILAYTLPSFATSTKTKESAWALMRSLGVTAQEIDLTDASKAMLLDIGHPYARGEKVYDITFENVQAGARTSVLFRLANMHGGIVLGTGDLSELGLGWCTYGVGDHMSHYNVNASVSKTLIQHLIRWVADTGTFGEEARAVLYAILATEISPELVPGDDNKGEPAQKTEDFVGPYALQDFNLYFTTRYGFAPSKIAFLAHHAWSDATSGVWPPMTPDNKRVDYDLATIAKWLRVFLRRFFATSQFKRSAVPNGPKVSSGGSLSPRGDWRAPSDGNANVWLDELEAKLPPLIAQMRA
ncbi:MAG TPA: NAD(+) synthase [Ensifer sp.]|nr:NAD(+) synthase [Ensifer sp.]